LTTILPALAERLDPGSPPSMRFAAGAGEVGAKLFTVMTFDAETGMGAAHLFQHARGLSCLGHQAGQ
jgi:hypothetical protein